MNLQYGNVRARCIAFPPEITFSQKIFAPECCIYKSRYERWSSDFRERPTSSHLHCCLTVKSATLWRCSTRTRALSPFPGGPSSKSWPEDIQRGRSAIIYAISGRPRGKGAAAILAASGGGGRGAAAVQSSRTYI